MWILIEYNYFFSNNCLSLWEENKTLKSHKSFLPLFSQFLQFPIQFSIKTTIFIKTITSKTTEATKRLSPNTNYYQRVTPPPLQVSLNPKLVHLVKSKHQPPNQTTPSLYCLSTTTRTPYKSTYVHTFLLETYTASTPKKKNP